MSLTPDRLRRPDRSTGAALVRVDDSLPVYAIPTVHAVIRLNVRRANTDEPQRLDRLVQEAGYAPVGATVILDVGKGQLPPCTALMWLRDNASHVGRYVIECEDTVTASRWLEAFREFGGCR